jgi:hypothetical protein
MTGGAFVVYPLIVLAMHERDIAVLGFKYDGLRWFARE